jgi:hypothetical protein
MSRSGRAAAVVAQARQRVMSVAHDLLLEREVRRDVAKISPRKADPLA